MINVAAAIIGCMGIIIGFVLETIVLVMIMLFSVGMNAHLRYEFDAMKVQSPAKYHTVSTFIVTFWIGFISGYLLQSLAKVV